MIINVCKYQSCAEIISIIAFDFLIFSNFNFNFNINFDINFDIFFCFSFNTYVPWMLSSTSLMLILIASGLLNSSAHTTRSSVRTGNERTEQNSQVQYGTVNYSLWCCTFEYITLQYSTYSTVQYVQYSTVRTVQYITVHCSKCM